jgi:WD repeat-containing protein 48
MDNRLWSVGEHRCLHTFNHHTSSVWALQSNHPNLERFYSGSRDGHLCVVDVEQCGDISEGECVVLAREGDSRPGHFESKTGDEAIRSIASMDDEYVWTATSSSDVRRWRDVGRRVCRMDLDLDGASYPAVDDAAQPLVQPMGRMSIGSIDHPTSIIDNPLRNKQLALEGDDELTRIESRDSRTISFAPDPKVENGGNPQSASSPPTSPPRPGLPAAVRDRINAQGSRRVTSINSVMSESPNTENFLLNGIPYESLVCLGLPDSPYSFGFSGAGHSTASLSSAMHARSPEDTLDGGAAPERSAPPRAAARRAFEDRDIASEAKPFRLNPDAVIAGSPGLIRSLVLNDRMHVLTLNTAGEVAVWHLIRGTCLGRFDYKDVAEAIEFERGVADARTEMKMHPQEVLELVQHRIEGKNCVLPWCQVDTKVGQITVHLEGDRVFAAEILAEEVGSDVLTPEDSRPLNIGKVVLGNLFQGLIKAEGVEVESAISSSPTTQSSSLPSISRSPAPTHIPISSPRHRQRALSSTSLSGGMTPTINIAGLATRASRAAIRPDPPLGQSAPAASVWLTPAASTIRSAATPASGTPKSVGDIGARDYFSVRKQPETAARTTPSTPVEKKDATSPVASSGGLLSKKFKFGKKKNPEPQMTTVVESKLEEPPRDDTTLKLTERDRNQLLFLDQLRSKNFAPPSSSEVPHVSIPDSTAVIISEQSQADGAYFVTYRSQVSSTERDIEPLEMNSPFWLLNFLFVDSTPEERRPPKIPLILCPDGEAASSPRA